MPSRPSCLWYVLRLRGCSVASAISLQRWPDLEEAIIPISARTKKKKQKKQLTFRIAVYWGRLLGPPYRFYSATPKLATQDAQFHMKAR